LDIQNAIAFQYEGYSFVAITVSLIYAISFLNEVMDVGCVGNLETQIKELAADGCSVDHLLSNLIHGRPRYALIGLLRLDAE
jgi:hypothetical protein